MERRADRNGRRGPEPSAMVFDDSFTDRQAHSHPTGLGSEERIKNTLCRSSIEPEAAILYHDEHLVILADLRLDRQDATAVSYR